MKNVFSPLITVLLLLIICLSFLLLNSCFSCVIPESKVQHEGNKASTPNQYDKTFSVHRFDECVDLQTNICRCIEAWSYFLFDWRTFFRGSFIKKCGYRGKAKGDECTNDEHKPCTNRTEIEWLYNRMSTRKRKSALHGSLFTRRTTLSRRLHRARVSTRFSTNSV